MASGHYSQAFDHSLPSSLLADPGDCDDGVDNVAGDDDSFLCVFILAVA